MIGAYGSPRGVDDRHVGDLGEKRAVDNVGGQPRQGEQKRIHRSMLTAVRKENRAGSTPPGRIPRACAF